MLERMNVREKLHEVQSACHVQELEVPSSVIVAMEIAVSVETAPKEKAALK